MHNRRGGGGGQQASLGGWWSAVGSYVGDFVPGIQFYRALLPAQPYTGYNTGRRRHSDSRLPPPPISPHSARPASGMQPARYTTRALRPLNCSYFLWFGCTYR